ncbi:CheR family methyltransferase [Rhodospirillaceae bacterium SYSU D60014]|uniref:CheR family methyltransferase n=1 Tax=Virgifigura deserti TaxID=2268457 RepID=UPI000E674CBF
MAEQSPSNSARYRPRRTSDTHLIVGIGASAGGLPALKAFFHQVPADAGIAFVVLQHISDSERNLLPELLDKMTEMPVVAIERDVSPAPNHVYVTPPSTILSLQGGRFQFRPPRNANESRDPIDIFFRSLAAEYGPRAVGIILSGGGTDGTLGMEAISGGGGMTMVQDPESAAHAGMPSSATLGGLVDHIVPPVELAAELLAYARHWNDTGAATGATGWSEEIAGRITDICELLRRQTGHNFKHYKTSTLVRRIQRRMQVLHLHDVETYLRRLAEDAQETQALFKELLIGVTAFFRDPEAFDALNEEVLPGLFSARAPGDQIRIWVPGCATGEEAYTIAMLVREQLDRLDVARSVQIFATDIDERALAIARKGQYAQGIANQITPDRLKRFFIKRGRYYQISKEIRELCLFSAHNLISDPPFSRIDLISCRNLLIYLGPHLQKKLFPVFHYALRPGGYLFLGSSETLTGHAELFRPIDTKHRLSQRKETGLRAPEPLHDLGGAAFGTWRSLPATGTPDLAAIAQRIVLDEFAPKYAIVGEEGQVVYLSEGMAKYVEPPTGNFSNSIVRMARQGLRVGLRAALNEAIKTRRSVVHDALSVKTEQGLQQIRLTVQPMPALGQDTGMFMLVFQDMGAPVDRRDRADGSAIRDADMVIDQLERELLRTREDLERTVQDLEAANEELKSSNEELRSMNEELQSANEELETSKEEVQSANNALAKANADLENLLRSTRIATIFLNNERHIRSFTPVAAQLYNLIPGDVGRPLNHVTHRFAALPPLPSDDEIDSRSSPIEHEAQTVDGRWFLRRVLPYRTLEGAADGVVITFLDISRLKQTQEALRSVVAEKEDLLHHKDVLLKELNHRIKNSLQLVASLLALQSRTVPKEAQQQLAEATSRINAVARVHQRLYQRSEIDRVDFGAYLHEFCADLADTLGMANRAVHLRIEAEPVELPTDQVIPLALIINELITNAFKYAFPGDSIGTIAVESRLEADGTLQITVRDDGAGLPVNVADETGGLGMKLINALAHQLDARFEILPGSRGAAFQIRLSVPQGGQSAS